MFTKFFDYESGRYFNGNFGSVYDILKELERKSHTGIVKYTEYFEKLILPIPEFANTEAIIGKKEHNYIIEFELLPSDDCTVIYINT